MNIPTEYINLPSKGYFYEETNELSKGKVELKYMTAYHEDILTNANYIKQGIVLDKLLESLIVSPVKLEDMLLGDKNALLLGARILGYGKDYNFSYNNENINIDLTTLEPKEIDFSQFQKGKNIFNFTLPSTGKVITFKLLTHGDEIKINQELDSLKKITKNIPELSTRLKYMIIEVDGKTEKTYIKDFIDKYMLARDSKAFREYIKTITPNMDLTFNYTNEDGLQEKVDIPINANFFWPDIIPN